MFEELEEIKKECLNQYNQTLNPGLGLQYSLYLPLYIISFSPLEIFVIDLYSNLIISGACLIMSNDNSSCMELGKR